MPDPDGATISRIEQCEHWRCRLHLAKALVAAGERELVFTPLRYYAAIPEVTTTQSISSKNALRVET